MDKTRLVRTVRLLLPALLLAALAIPVLDFAFGSVCVLTIGPVTFACPLGFLQTSLASHGLILGLLVPALMVIVATALFGRFFCGWFCPAGPILQSLESVGASRRTIAQRLKNISHDHKSRIVLLASVLVTSAVLRYPVFCLVCPVGVIYRNAISLTQYGSVGLDLLFIPMLVALEIGLAPWCSRICPLGTLLSIFSRRSPITPSIEKGKCTSCMTCVKVCKMKVPLLQGKNLEDCSRCLDCVHQCPTDAVELKKNGFR